MKNRFFLRRCAPTNIFELCDRDAPMGAHGVVCRVALVHHRYAREVMLWMEEAASRGHFTAQLTPQRPVRARHSTPKPAARRTRAKR